ncbi:MAG: nucleotide exchange factor GrpE [Legionellales bacterium]|nr:nucleotide exchange factor GrpE [Legionellales bacterium]|tara:strand:- start:10358 stop:10945 length:588 start_codon:yes stop_codon:yes gene_type:complete
MTKSSNESENTPENGDSFAAATDKLGGKGEETSLDIDGLTPEAVKEKLVEALEMAENNREQMLRALAELENMRNRTARDISNAHKFALQKFVTDLLPVVDSLEQGLDASGEEDASVQAIREGMQLTMTMLLNLMEKFSITQINPVGEPFNPDEHEAMSMVKDDKVAPGSVITVIQKGYSLHGRVIRAARVIVAQQ